MRMTQYIGLTKKAQDFVASASREAIVVTSGMFEEDVYGYKYTLGDGTVWVEVVQAEPWSSGPMIFTHLKKEDAKEYYGSWVQDRSLRGQEFDVETGLFWV